MKPLTCFLVLATPLASFGLVRAPPMGYNTWNFYGVSVNATILMDTGAAMKGSGLLAAGYEFVNSDDAWMLLNRTTDGRQIANPEKFPDGFQAVTAYLHSLGMKSGLYTAKGPTTCAGFAASCKHEVQDAQQWAAWGIDYVKDDSCSNCRNNDTLDYMTMWSAIQASGRDMVLTIEGDPDDATCSAGGCGNAKRVGHDISPLWMSMLSLVDIGSGLWKYAHNATDAGVDGWFNDLDIMEIGNGIDFNCSAGTEALARCAAHMTMWSIMKAPLLLGTDLMTMAPETLSVLSNAEVLAVNQDSWGIQARRVAVQTPLNTSLTRNFNYDNIATIGKCNASEPTQQWVFDNSSSHGRADGLFLQACDSTSPFQQWAMTATGLRNVGANACIDANGRSDPGQVLACNASKSSQDWSLNLATGQIYHGRSCLDVFNFVGPDVFFGSCKAAGDPSISNQVFMPPDAAGLIRSNDTGAPPNSCLAVSAGPPGGTLRTKDADDNVWCLSHSNGAEGCWHAVDCNATGVTQFLPQTNGNTSGTALYALSGMGFNNQVGASGPWPHTRYISGGYSWDKTPQYLWLADFSAGTPSTTIRANNNNIIDDDLVGGVTAGGDFCLQFNTAGLLEVWAGALSGDRLAVALFNRSPGADSISVRWQDVGLAAGTTVKVRDLWAQADLGTFSSDFTLPVASRATMLLLLTPL